MIKYTVNGGTEQSHTITDADKAAGHVEVKVPVTDGQTSSVTAKIVDQAGNVGKEAKESLDVDTKAPSVENVKVTPVDTNSPADGNPDKATVTGKSDEPNAPVVVKDKDGNVIGEGKTDDEGKFVIDTTKPVKPGDKVTVEVTDNAGNTGKGEGTAGNMDFNDNVAPDAPVITEVTDNAYGGIENGGNVLGINDGFTNDNTPTFKGTAEPNTTIVLKNGNDIIGKDVIVKADGSWEFTPKTPLADGEYNVVAIATDKAGNVSAPSNVATINIDTHVTTPVITEIIDDVAGGIVNGDVKNGLTNDNTPTLKGTAEPGSTVKVWIDGLSKGSLVNGEVIYDWTTITKEDGTWEFTTPKLSDGSHTFKVQTTDRAGNNSPESSVFSVNVDTTIGNPKVRFVEDTDGNGVLSVAEVAAIKDGKAHWVIDIPTDGSVKAGDVIQSIDGKGNWVKFVEITDEMIKDGRFEATFNVDINKLKDGKYETPEYRFADEAGNVSESSKASLTLDSEFSRQPSNPSITFPEDNDPKDGKISDKENKAGDNDAGKTTAEISIPKDGSVKPGDKLVVTDENGKQTEKIIEQGDIDNGNIKVPVDLNPGKDNTIIAEIVNPNNPDNPGKGKGVIGENSEATKAPEAPVITDVIDDVKGGKFNEDVKGGLTNDSTPTIKGTAKAGSKVIIYDNGVEIGRIEKADANWEFTTPVLTKQGEHKFTAIAKNEFGESAPSNEVTIDLDTKTEKPVIKEIIDNVEGDTGDISSKNNWTNDNTPTLKGSAEAGADVDIYVDSKKAGSVKANDKGEWEYTTGKLSDGDHRFYVEATDKAGNAKESDVEAIKVDTNPGQVVITSVTDDNGVDALKGAYDGATTDNTPTINGFAEPYSTVTVSVKDSNGKVVWSDEIYVDDSLGDWSITVDKPLNDGDYTVEASMQDYVKNPVQNSNVVSLTVDTATNIPEIKEIVDNVAGGVVNGDVKNGLTNDNTPTLKGSAEAGADIKVFIDGKIAGTTKAGFDGSWDFTPRTKLGDGEHKFVVEATDKLGHSAKSVEASVDVDTTAPSVENVKVTPVDMSDPADNTPEKGRVEGSSDTPGAIVVIKDQAGKEVIGSGKVGNDGKFNIETTKPINTGDKVKVEITDDAGNTGKGEGTAGDIKHEGDFAAPCDPTITFVEDIAPKDGKLNKAENSSDSDNASTKAHISFFPDVVEGDVIKYSINNGEEKNHPITADDVKLGYIAVDVPVVDGKTSSVTAKIVDQAGNASEAVTSSIDVDTTAGAPKVMITADADDNNILTATEASALTDGKLKWVIKLPEDAKVGDRIEVANSHREWVTVLTLSAADIKAGTITRDDFSADLVKGKTGFQTPSYRIVDQTGNISAEDADSVRFDKTAPKAPVIKEVIDDHKGYDDDTRVGNVLDVKGGLTNDNTPTIKGTAEAGIKVDIYDNGKWIGDAKANANGNWEFTPSVSAALPDGKHSITAVAKNALDVESAPSDAANIDVDTVTPKPTIDKITDNVEGGVYHGDVKGGLTNDNRPVFEGSAEKGAFIELFDNGKVIGTTEANENGKWTIQPKEPMADGKHDMVVQATDLAGNRSRSDQSSSDVETNAGVVKITAVCDDVAGYNGKVGNILGVNNGLTNDSTPTIKGTAKPGTTITIKDGNSVIDGVIKYNGDGSWEFTPKTSFADGKHELTAIATSKTGAQSVSNKAAIDVDTSIRIELTEVTPIAEGGTPGAHISKPTIIMNTISRGNHIPTTTGDDYVKVKGSVNNRANINLCDGNDTLAIGGVVTDGVVINAGRGNDKIVIGDYLGGLSSRGTKIDLGEGGANIVKTHLVGESDECNAKFIIKDKNNIQIGEGKTDADGKFDMFIDKAIKPGEKLSVEIVDAAGNKASDSKAASHIEASGVRYYDNELDVGTNIHAATVVAGNGNDLVVVGEKGKPDGYITANSKIDLGEGDNEIRVRTNIDHSEIKTGSGDDIVTTGLKGNGFGYITNESKIDLGDGNNKLNVGANIDGSTIELGKGDDTAVVKGWINDNAVVNLGDGNNTLTVGTNIDKATVLAGSGNDEVVVGKWQHAGDSWITNYSTIKLGDGDNKLTVGTNIDSSSIETGKGNDVIKVGGYIHSSKVDLGAGDDTLSIGKVDLDNSKVDGGAGYDKLVLENPDKSVNLSDISKFASNFEELDISGAKNTTLEVSIKDVLDMTDDKNTLKITGDKGDIVDLKENIGAGGWSKGASEDGYTTYTNNTVTIQIKDEIHVI